MCLAPVECPPDAIFNFTKDECTCKATYYQVEDLSAFQIVDVAGHDEFLDWRERMNVADIPGCAKCPVM